MNDYVDSFYRDTRSAGDARSPLTGAQEAEVCVIGGGLAGLSTALEFAERDVDVVLLERNRVGWGASGRNGGMVSPGFSLGLKKIIAKLGQADARELYDLSRDGAEAVRERIARFEMADVPMGDGVFSTTLFDEAGALLAQQAFMAEVFDEHYEYWPKERLVETVRSSRYQAGLLDTRRFMIHPLNYCRGVADAAETFKARIYEQTHVRGFSKQGTDHVVHTADGQVTCRAVVVAAGGYIERLVLSLARAIVPVATYVMATEPLGEERLRSALASDYGVSDNRLANDYYRPVADTRILWGGRMTVRRDRPPNLSQLMLQDLVSIYPQLAGIRVASAWHGLMSYPAHKMPLVGELSPGFWYALGFGGHGLNTTTMAGRMVASAISEGDDRYRLLAPFGLMPTGGPIGAAAAQCTYWYYQLVDAWRAMSARKVAASTST